MVRSNKEARYMPLWRGLLLAPSVSTSLDLFGYSDRRKVAELYSVSNFTPR